MTTDMMMGERDFEVELQEKDEIIMSLRLNEHLLKDKLEISRRNMSKQLERITALEKENIELKKYKKYCAEWMGVKEENLSLRCVKISEKRFVCIDIGYGDEWYITDNGKRLSEMEIVDLLNKQQSIIEELKEENEYYKNSKYENLVTATTKAIEDLYRTEEVYLADFDIWKRITEYERELLDDDG